MSSKFKVGDCVEFADALINEIYTHSGQEHLLQALEEAEFCAIVRCIKDDIITLSPVGDQSVAMSLSLKQVSSLLHVVPDPASKTKGGGFDAAPPVISQAFGILNKFLDFKQDAMEQACQIYRYSKMQQMGESEDGWAADTSDTKPFAIRLGESEQSLLDTSTYVLQRYLQAESDKLHKRKPARPTVQYNIALSALPDPLSPLGAMHSLVSQAARSARAIKPGKISRAAKANQSPDSPPAKPAAGI